jgi:hypothetical protein
VEVPLAGVGTPGIADYALEALVDPPTTIEDLATAMGRLGDTDPLGVRRSRALASLADPQRTLDLYGNPPTRPHPRRCQRRTRGPGAVRLRRGRAGDASAGGRPGHRRIGGPGGAPGGGPGLAGAGRVSVTPGARDGTAAPATSTPTSRSRTWSARPRWRRSR